MGYRKITWVVNHSGHFLLCGLVFDRIERLSPRIVMVGSQGYKIAIQETSVLKT